MIRVYKSECQSNEFYALMGYYFASLDVAKELERQVYNKPDTTWYINTLRDKVIAFASVHDSGRYYFLDNLYVVPNYRSIGNASEIVKNIVEAFTDKPIKCIAINPYAIRIFESMGFIEDGTNGKYKKYIKH